jgi:hypothetical protein
MFKKTLENKAVKTPNRKGAAVPRKSNSSTSKKAAKGKNTVSGYMKGRASDESFNGAANLVSGAAKVIGGTALTTGASFGSIPSGGLTALGVLGGLSIWTDGMGDILESKKHYDKSGEFKKASDMWANTGMPSGPNVEKERSNSYSGKLNSSQKAKLSKANASKKKASSAAAKKSNKTTASKSDGFVEGHHKRVNGKTVSVKRRQMTAAERRRSR